MLITVLCLSSAAYLRVRIRAVFTTNLALGLLFVSLFGYVFVNEVHILILLGALLFLCLLLYLIVPAQTLKLVSLHLKSYYLFFLAFTTVFSLYEVLAKRNAHLLSNEPTMLLLVLFGALLLYLVVEGLLFMALPPAKFDFLFSGLSFFIPLSMFVMLIGKSYSFLFIALFSRHTFLVSVLILASCLLEFYFGVFVLMGIAKAYDLSMHKHQTKILQDHYEMQLANLREVETYQTQIRRLSHDLHHHKITLQCLLKDQQYEEAQTYLDVMEQNLPDATPSYTSHKILNAMLVHKQTLCRELHIRYEVHAQSPATLSIYDFDLSVMIGNLLDNALDACKEVAEPDAKFIRVHAKVVNDNFVFEVQNRYNGVLEVQKDGFATTKKDKRNHGLGLSNVARIVDHYQGALDFQYDTSTFTALLRLPLTQ
ncbi:MAG: sensor histidine kinase [Erysipelotrichaceae bacterium]